MLSHGHNLESLRIKTVSMLLHFFDCFGSHRAILNIVWGAKVADVFLYAICNLLSVQMISEFSRLAALRVGHSLGSGGKLWRVFLHAGVLPDERFEQIY